MSKGLIVCGYPGVGKSSIGGWNNCIDLESSYFSHRAYVPQKLKSWVPQYCAVAISLAQQGFTVLVSTHKEVIAHLIFTIFPQKLTGIDVEVVIFCPDHRYKQEWIERLKKRVCLPNALDKHERALQHVEEHFDDDMDYLNNCGLPVYIPAWLDYDLRDYINRIRKIANLRTTGEKQ